MSNRKLKLLRQSTYGKPAKKNPERQLGVQTSWDAVRFLRINDNHWAVCYLKRRSSHLQMKYRLTPDTTFAATVTRNKVPTVFTSFQKQEGTTCKCILQETFYQDKLNIFDKACKRFGGMINCPCNGNEKRTNQEILGEESGIFWFMQEK